MVGSTTTKQIGGKQFLPTFRFDFLGNEDVYSQISPFTLTRSAPPKTDRLLVAENIRSFDEASTKRETLIVLLRLFANVDDT